GAICIQLSTQETPEGGQVEGVEGEGTGGESEGEGNGESDGEGEGNGDEEFDEYFFDARDEELTKELDLMEVQCGDTFRLKDEGYLTFKMNSPKEICKYQFIGTKTDNCTVAFMCKGKVHFKSPDKNNGCVDEYIKISDGTDGRMAGCGAFIFDDRPRVARNGGSDIYFTFKGIADDAICVVFCKQDAKICGKKDVPQGRIVGGDTTQKFEFPWIAAMLMKIHKPKRWSFCGASLINDRYAISAAHCFEHGLTADKIQLLFHAHLLDQKVGTGTSSSDQKYQQIPGWNDPKETDESEGSYRMDVESVMIHPKFDISTFEYDIALLKLKYKFNLKKDKVTPICLPEVPDDFNYTGKYLTVAGWGRFTEKLSGGVRRLQKLDVPFHTLEECRKYNRATSRHICAGYLKGGKDSCSGDSGGPLMYKTDPMKNQHTLAGIVSAGRGCARANALGLYTNVEELVQWVYHHTESATWCKKS
ncbi:Plasma kallikrein, partial [Orchesella cincta]